MRRSAVFLLMVAAMFARAQNERLLLRTTTHTKQVVDEIGMEASTTVALTVPIVHGDLDLAHAQMPPHLHVAAWKR